MDILWPNVICHNPRSQKLLSKLGLFYLLHFLVSEKTSLRKHPTVSFPFCFSVMFLQKDYSLPHTPPQVVS